tara:strand:- start:114 stop:326 length:213 start_codon:yes stop_codon:yes gene_type:complete
MPSTPKVTNDSKVVQGRRLERIHQRKNKRKGHILAMKKPNPEAGSVAKTFFCLTIVFFGAVAAFLGERGA